jgi:Predicted membrane protein
MEVFKGRMRRLISIVMKPELRILPGQLAFFLFLSLFPILSILVYLSGTFTVSTDIIIHFLENNIPSDISSLLIPYLMGKGISFGTIFSMIVGFIVASNGAHSIIVASNALYKIDDSPYLQRRLKSIIMTIILILLFIILLVILAFGNTILNFIFSLGLFENIKGTISMIFYIVKWSLAIFAVLFLLKVLYTMAPDKKIKSKYMNKGAIFTTLSFIVATTIYSFYVSNFSNYDLIYGGLSSIMMLVMFVYLLSYIFVIGIAINAGYYEWEMEKTGYNILKNKE